MLKGIRRAEIKDIEKLIDLLYQIREYHCDFREDIFLHNFIKYEKDELKELLKDESMAIFVAVNENDEAIGHLYCKIKNIDVRDQTKRKELYVDDICVDENARCQGIGNALMKKAEDFAKELDCDFLTLNFWEGNKSAENFYYDFGMKPRYTALEKRLK